MGVIVSERLMISDRAHITTNMHIAADEFMEKQDAPIGSTKKGVGYTYASKMLRQGIRVCDLKDIDVLKSKFKGLYKHHHELYG